MVDVWDALTSERPYRPAWPVKKVWEYILEQSGRQFDPRVVEAFLAMVEPQKDLVGLGEVHPATGN